jgi:hypothetical protein
VDVLVFFMMLKRGQLTIFIIIAVIIMGTIILFFVTRELITKEVIPVSIMPVETSFLFCLEEDLMAGIDLLEIQAGYIDLPDFEPGSIYTPFSSQLNFLGNPIPYWYYVSGNNIPKEQVPSKDFMERQLEEFVEREITKCRFSNYYDEGFDINKGEPKARVVIGDDKVDISLEMGLSISFGNDSVVISDHEITVNSRLGLLYDAAKKVYDYEQSTLFLEDYAVDTLRLYAPVDGVELTCSPKIWNANNVFDDLEEAIEANTLALKVKGGDYSLRDTKNKYFILDIDMPTGENVMFVNSQNWPHTYEVSPSDDSLLIANPVGNQPGLGIMGFCYVPYHFVYNIKYPVLVQIFSGEEIFQFPLAVVIEGNKPRKALDIEAIDVGLPELCNYKNTVNQ